MKSDSLIGRVLVFAPIGRDAAMICDLLAKADIDSGSCGSIEQLCRELDGADAAIITEEALTKPAVLVLIAALATQPLWSDLPLIILGVPNSSSAVRLFETLSPVANLTLVERPARPFTIVTVTRGALRSRRRQHATRVHLSQIVNAREEIARQRDKLADARTRLESTLSAGEIGTWTWDVRTDRVVADRNVARIFGLTPGEAEDSRLAVYVERVHPDDRARVLESIMAAVNGHDAFEADYRVVGDDNSVRTVLARGRVVRNAEGVVTTLPGVLIDITDRIRSEAARRELLAEIERQARVFDKALSGITDFVYQFDRRGRFIYANHALLNLWGVSLGDVIGRNFLELDHPHELATRLQSQIEHVFQTGEDVRDEMEYVSPGGIAGNYEYIFSPVRAPDGRIEVVTGSTRDVTARTLLDNERRALLESERSARAEAERIGRMKDEFLSTLSHELRTPLNAITGWTQLLRRGTLSEADTAKAIDTIARNTQAQKALIEDLLDMSRIVSGKGRLEVQPVNLASLINETVESVKPMADGKGVNIFKSLATLPRPVRGDPARLQQILWNLINNAVKFTPRGGRVTVTLEPVGSYVEISVADTGVGIPAQFIPHVFDRFRQADASSTRRHGGLGLGLSIVKQLTDMHHGQVKASSAGEGKGSTFTVILPASADIFESPHAHGGATQREIAAYEPAMLEGTTVLVIDDDADGREVVQRFLEESHARVHTAASVDDALHVLETEAIDVVLSDIGMPGRDGYDLIRSIRSSASSSLRQIPAAALTAFVRPEDCARAIQAGYDSHVAKPIEPAELLTVVVALRRKLDAARSQR